MSRTIEAGRYLSLVDLTSLDLEDTAEKIRALCAKAASPPVHTAAVCVYPKWITCAKECLKDAAPDVAVATVINFPQGNLKASECQSDIEAAKAASVDEIDFVIDWRRFKLDQRFLEEYVREMVNLCKPCKTKVILETSELSPEEIRTAARICISCGVDFLKTSTGKLKSGGATVEAVKILAEEIKASGKSIGIKPSGGIKTFEDCQNLWKTVTDILGTSPYGDKTHFRFGASGVRDQLLLAIENPKLETRTQCSEAMTMASEDSVTGGISENY